MLRFDFRCQYDEKDSIESANRRQIFWYSLLHQVTTIHK